MKEKHSGTLEKHIQELKLNIRKFGNGDDMEELIRLMRHTEFTTPAESLLVSAMVQALNVQTRLIFDLKNTLLTASRQACKKKAFEVLT